MGEAAYRKTHDPLFGKVPKGGRGLVISPPVEVEGNSLLIKSGDIDPQELRFSLLFWDRLCWPRSSIFHFESSQDIQFLQSAGILSRPNLMKPYNTVDAAEHFAQSHVQSFLDLDEKEPGCWAIAQGENSFYFKDLESSEIGRSMIIKLMRSIPVPNYDVPLQEILEFKTRRYDELIALRVEIDNAYKSIIQSGDVGFEYRTQMERIDKACADAISVSKEWSCPIRIANMDVSFELDMSKVSLAALSGAALAQMTLPSASFALAATVGAASTIKITGKPSFSKGKRSSLPFQYVGKFHDEIF